MARIRTVKPDFWRDDALSEISAEAALLAIGLLNHSDDEGYFKANPKLIEADVFPLRKLSRSIPVLLRELSDIGYLSLFLGTDNREYGSISNFSKHQSINKPTASKIKELYTIPKDSRSDTVALPLGKERKGKEKEVNGSARFDAVQHLVRVGADKSLVNEWFCVRKSKKAHNSETAMNRFLSEVGKSGKEINEVLRLCVEKSWSGFSSTWGTGEQQISQPISGSSLRNLPGMIL